MIPIPAARSTLVKGPWVTAGAQALLCILHVPALGQGAAWLAALSGTASGLATAYLLYRSDYGTRHGFVAAAVLGLLFGTAAAGAASAAIAIDGSAPELVPWVIAGAWLTVLAAAGVSALRCRTALGAAEGADGRWLRQSVDLVHGRLRAGSDAAVDREYTSSVQVLTACAAVNLPWLLRAWRIDGLALFPWLAAGMIAAAAWASSRLLGPMIGRALYLASLERRQGLHFVHDELESLQALRASYWLSRWLMPGGAAAAPGRPAPRGAAPPSAAPHRRTQR
jgi:hypothetical protein